MLKLPQWGVRVLAVSRISRNLRYAISSNRSMMIDLVIHFGR